MVILKKVIIISILAVFAMRPLTAFGESGIKGFFENLLNIKNEQQKKLDEVRKEKIQKEAKLNKLDSEIENAEDQISQASESVSSITREISETKQDIKVYQNKIEELEGDMAPLKQKLSKIIPVYHQLSVKSSIEKFLTAPSLSAAINEMRIYNEINRSISQSFLEMNDYKKELEAASDGLVEYQEKYEELKKREITQKNLIESEKKYKEKLLAKTQTEIEALARQEAELSKREQEVEEEINKYLSEYKSSEQSSQSVKKGEIIGYQGNSGFSTGSHLHFTVFVDNNLKKHHDPNKHLKNSHLAYPLEKWRLTQGYGMTSFARTGAYSGGPHNGIDIANFPGAPVRAAGDGKIIMDKYFGSYGNAVIIDHGNNLYTLYGHLAK